MHPLLNIVDKNLKHFLQNIWIMYFLLSIIIIFFLYFHNQTQTFFKETLSLSTFSSLLYSIWPKKENNILSKDPSCWHCEIVAHSATPHSRAPIIHNTYMQRRPAPDEKKNTTGGAEPLNILHCMCIHAYH